MRKIGKRVLVCAILALAVWTGALLRDRKLLNRQLIRLHVVANSDSETDQALKLQVRDGVVQWLRENLEDVGDVEAARVYLQENLPKLQQLAGNVLKKAGWEGNVAVSLCREVFDARQYDTFSLPAGVYEALRIVIGEGQGHNWWCVAFPSLCIPATAEGFAAEAVAAGLPATLTHTLTEEPYEVRFFLLDCLGKVEGWLKK